MIPVDIRLAAKREVIKMATSLKTEKNRLNELDKELGLTLPQKICKDELMKLKSQLRKEIKAKLTGQDPSTLLSILKPEEIETVFRKYITNVTESAPTRPQATFNIPQLDISSVRKDMRDDEPLTPRNTKMQPVVQERDMPQDPEPPSSYRSAKGNSVSMSDNSKPSSFREVTDSSAEMSDLARKVTEQLLRDPSFRAQVDQNRLTNKLQDLAIEKKPLPSPPRANLIIIPSTPIREAEGHSTFVTAREVQVQTELYEIERQVRDIATDAPTEASLPSISSARAEYSKEEEISSSTSVDHSDLSTGQLPNTVQSNLHKVVNVLPDGSLLGIGKPTDIQVSSQLSPSLRLKTPETHVVQPLVNDVSDMKDLYSDRDRSTPNLRTPRVSESPWRPSSKMLHLKDVDISSSNASDGIETVFARPYSATKTLKDKDKPTEGKKTMYPESSDELLADSLPPKRSISSTSSHQDEETTYNQVSQISSV